MKTKTSTSIVTYIGNGVVKGGIVYHEMGKKPVILSARKNVLKYNEDRGADQLETQIVSEFDHMLNQIRTEDFPKIHNKKCDKPDTAIIVLASPWYLSETNTIKMKEENLFTVTENLIEKAVANLTKAHKEDSTLSVLEQSYLSVFMNGYSLNNPIGKKAKDLDITVFNSYVKTDLLKTVKDLMHKNFHLHNIFIHSKSLVTYSAIGDMYPAITDYVIVDITTAITEVWITRGGVLKDTGSFPYGKSAFINSIAKSMMVNPEVAESLIKSYLSNHIEDDKKMAVISAVKIAQNEWVGNLNSVLKNLSLNNAIPRDFFMFAPQDLSELFKNFVESEEYQQSTMSEGNFNVQIMSITNSCNLCAIDFDQNYTADLDTSVALGTLFNNKKLFS